MPESRLSQRCKGWIEAFIRRQISRNYGPQAVAMQLKVKGISPEAIRAILPYFPRLNGKKAVFLTS